MTLRQMARDCPRNEEEFSRLTGRPLNGFVFVQPEGLHTRRALQSWLTAALRFAASLPAKHP